jgi:hypothetical protein
MNGATFRKYDHLERLAHSEVSGIELGTVHVFPKLDGTNAVAWCAGDGTIRGGSRNRELSLEADNAGFLGWLLSDDERAEALRDLLKANPSWIIYGEWLVPHTLRTYRDEAWRRFWIFDVFDTVLGKYVPWIDYGPPLSNMGLDVIEPLCMIQDPSEAQLRTQLEVNTYLIQDGAGVGEGVVIKNYSWRNKYGRQPWAKIVKNEFRERNARAFGVTHKQGEFTVERAIVDEFVTPTLVGKTRAKVVLDIANGAGIDLGEPNTQNQVEEDYRGRVIPQLLGRVWHDLITEDIWSILKKYKRPVIDFGKLEKLTLMRVKELAGDLF